MSKICCIPGCPSKRPTPLYKVPAKKFCFGEKLQWADNLECIILGLRADTSIHDLFKRDLVKICGIHFNESDFTTSCKYELVCIAIL